MKRVEGKVALVTGGAMGIGEATCHLLAREGAKVAVTDINVEAGEAVVCSIVESGGSARFYRHDVANQEDWQCVIQDVTNDLGPLDTLVNNAGIAIVGTVEDATLDDWRKTQRINLESVFVGTQEAIAVMKGRGGSIINLSSVMGLVGGTLETAYCASKGGVRMFTKSAAIHCAEQGYRIRVNSVHPGYIMTPLLVNAAAKLPNAEEVLGDLISRHPIGHLGDADDVAYGILYLASDESKFVTGSELVIDGGYTAK